MAKRKHVVGGCCPKCGGVDTKIEIDWLSVRGKCNSCGFEDQRLVVSSEDDLELAVQLAKQSFSTVVVGLKKDETGAPSVSEIAHDIAFLMRLVCKHSDCSSCPLDPGAPSKPEFENGHGGFAYGSKLGLSCRDQVESRCRDNLIESFPVYSLEY